MAQHDRDIANASGAAVRSDINNMAAGEVTLNSGASAPTTTFADMWWIDTTNNVLKQRNAANTAWIVRGKRDADGLVAKTAAYTVVLADFGKVFDATSGTWTLTLTAAATLTDGFWFGIRNSGTGVVTIDPNAAELIDGVATLALNPGDECLVWCNGTAFKTIGADTRRIRNDFALDGVISPATITADQNNYAPTGLETATVLRLATDASRNLTGLTAPSPERGVVKIIHNVGGFNLVLKDENASSTAANRFALSGDFILTADQSVMLHYDGTTDRWRLIDKPGAITAGSTLTKNPYATQTATTQAHGLGQTPHFYQMYMECLTADIGYSVGDRIDLGSVNQQRSSGTTAGWIVVGDTTNVVLILGAVSSLPILTNKGTPSAEATPTAANWKVIVIPYIIT